MTPLRKALIPLFTILALLFWAPPATAAVKSASGSLTCPSTKQRIIVTGYMTTPGTISLTLNGLPQDTQYSTGNYYLKTAPGKYKGNWKISTPNGNIATVSDYCSDAGPMLRDTP